MNMFELYAIASWPHVGGLALGFISALIARHKFPGAQDRPTRTLAIIGSAIALILAISPRFVAIFSMSTYLKLPLFLRPDYESSLYYSVPLFAGIFSVALMLCAPLPNSVSAGADLRPRSLGSFTNLGSLAGIGVLTAAAIWLAVAGGRTSTADEEGRYRWYQVDSGGVSGGTEIYGWYFSVPALITLSVLLLLTLFTLWRIARPQLGSDTLFDTAVRKSRSAVVTISVSAALLLHLGYVAKYLAGTASLKMGGRGGLHGAWVESWPTFAALESTLRTAGILLELAGLTLWAYIFWRAVLSDRKNQD